MKHIKKSSYALPFLLIFTVCLLLTTALFTTVALAADGDGEYVEAPVVIDFTNPDNVYGCYDVFNVALSCTDEGMEVKFAETTAGTNICFDPYFSLPLPAEQVDSADLHYMAILVKTNKQDLKMQIRLRTTSTGNSYPCYNATYADTDDWQLIVCDLTDTSKVMFHNGDITGTYTNFRLDMYENECPVDTSYVIKAYALYDNLEDAMTFANYESPSFSADDLLPDIDFSSFWRGEAFAHPDNFEKILWVDYGFNASTFESELDKFQAQGFGGIVSNVNFNQQYLKDEAEFELLKRVYKNAIEREMNVWIYDEYQWPSGKAYGQVLDGHDEYEATGILHKTLTGNGGTVSYALEGREIRVMEAILKDDDGERVLTLKDNVIESVTARGAWTLDIYVLQYTHSGEEDRTNFATLRDVDLLNKDAVSRFIELTHEHYKSAFGEDFSMVDAFFTDEPGLGNRDREDYAVWTDGLDTLFKETYGYDLPIHAIFEGNDDASKLARMQYYALVADLFKSSYIDQITEWCVANGVNSSGHLLFEENMNDQVEIYGGNFLQIIGGMTIPGADILWVDPSHLLSNCNIGSYMGLRYVTSGAKNAGRDRIMIEYNPSAVRTEEFSNDVMGSSIGGATLTRLFGTTEYTMINPQHDYRTDEINLLNNYIGRLNTLLAGTRETGDVGIFYPIATIQALHNADSIHSSAYGQNTKAVKLNNDYADLCKQLLTSQVLYTVIDDESICAAEISSDGRLVIGNGAYRVMILAYADYISAEAAEKLAAFCEAGGTVIFVEDAPTKSLDGKGDDRVAAAMASMSEQPSYKRNRVPKMCIDVAEMSNNVMTIGTCQGVAKTDMLYGDFADDGHDLSYFANAASTAATLSVTFRDGYDGAYTVYYPYSGNIQSGSGNKVTLSIPAYEAVIVMREDDNTAKAPVIGGETETDTQPETEEPTVEPTPETTVGNDATEAPTSVETSRGDEEKGCASVVSAASVAVIGMATAVAVAFKKKKEND